MLNIIAIFTGRKRVILAPPEELPNLYPAPFDRRVGGAFATLMDVYAPNFEKYPRFRDAVENIQIADIGPGEFLFMPPLWWHGVESDTFNMKASEKNCAIYSCRPLMEMAQRL